MKLNISFILAFVFAASPACTRNDPGPDREDISRQYCEVYQKCNPTPAYDDQSACEANSVMAYSDAEADNDPDCVEARLAYETCVGDFEACEDYVKHIQAMSDLCAEEVNAFYNYCEVV